jgi:NAD(P)-dependent dehydrogenase (short-subunit alcohol dehydrogenase family)
MTTYLVTGASTGIGRACVDELVRTGAEVWAAVRTDEDEKSLRDQHPDAVRVVRMDLTDPDSVRAAGERVCAAGPLHGLVNNAGVALPAPLEHVPLDVFRRQIEINLIGQLAVTQAVLPALRQAREQGAPARIVMVGSIGGRIAGPMLGPYHASKFGLVGLSDTLRAELAPSGIAVVLVEPGAVATPIWRRGGAAARELLAQLPAAATQRYEAQIAAAQANSARSAKRGIAPQRAAQVIVKALTAGNPRPRYLVGPDAHAAAAVARLPFRLRYRLTAARR